MNQKIIKTKTKTEQEIAEELERKSNERIERIRNMSEQEAKQEIDRLIKSISNWDD
jgi:hypothetical protein